jgi:hypothetical protein
MLNLGVFCVNLRERLAGIDANLDDLQSGIEACSRAADSLQTDTSKFDGLLKLPGLRSVVRHVKELRSCTYDQRAALQELQDSVALLREELHVARRATIRPSLVTVEDSQRRP